MRLLFFGRLRDLAGAAELPAPERSASLPALIDALAHINPALPDAVRAPGVRIAINQSFVSADADLSRAEEIAFMPPMSGG